jgi:hypothetical protein
MNAQIRTLDLNNLNELRDRCHAAAIKWWHTKEGVRIERNRGELLMLVVTELAEAVEGIRKGLNDDKLTHRTMEEVEMADAVIRLMDYAGGFDVDFNDAIALPHEDEKAQILALNKAEHILSICTAVGLAASSARDGFEWRHDDGVVLAVAAINAYCHSHNLDLLGAIEEKLAFNAKRADHTYEAREAAGGKKF